MNLSNCSRRTAAALLFAWLLSASFQCLLAAPPPDVTEPGAKVKGEQIPPHLRDESSAVAEYVINPDYPESLKKKGLSGSVVFEYVITGTGTVRDIKIVSSSHPAFSAEVVKAVSQWRFRPKLKDGKPLALRVRQVIDFSPTGPEAKK